MAAYEIRLRPSVEKDLRRLPKHVVRRVIDRIQELADDPFPRQAAKLAGAERTSRLRVGDYRIIYEVDVWRRLVSVHYVRHRSSAYDRI